MLGPKIKAKYGKILPELADPEERGPSSISEAKEDKADMLYMLDNTTHTVLILTEQCECTQCLTC